VLDSRLIQDMAAKYAELTRQQAELSQKFKPDWPAMVRLRSEIEETEERLETERRGIYEQVLGAAESAYRSARNQEGFLKSALDEQKRLSQEANLKEIDYNNLKAEIANQRTTSRPWSSARARRRHRPASTISWRATSGSSTSPRSRTARRLPRSPSTSC